jgi:hypothetical protein
LKISLPNGNSDYIRIHDDDEPNDLASHFSLRHSLSKSNQSQLEQLIEHQIDLLVERDFALMSKDQRTSRAKTPACASVRYSSRRKTETVTKNRSNVIIGRQVSDLLMQQKKEERFEIIFSMLQPGRDGKISAGTVAGVDRNIPAFEIISPILNEIRAKKKVVGLKEFKIQMEKLMEGLENSKIEVLLNSNIKANKSSREKMQIIKHY